MVLLLFLSLFQIETFLGARLQLLAIIVLDLLNHVLIDGVH